MGAFKLGVGTIILERDKRRALIQKQAWLALLCLAVRGGSPVHLDVRCHG